MDSAVVAERTGAVLVGGASTANLGRGAGLAADRILSPPPGTPVTLGAWTLTLIESHHCPPDRFPGVITEPVTPPVKVGAYKCGEAWSILLEHAGGRTALVQGSAGYVVGSLAGRRADVAYLGVGQLGVESEEYIETYWTETVRTVGARRAVLTHWDDFFSPLPMTDADAPLRALPYAGDDLDVTMRVLTRLADQDGVTLSFPTLWAREDPWVTR
jgi:L-ascorbate metabolism protein UlaG (beta-lactamase superfamily)